MSELFVPSQVHYNPNRVDRGDTSAPQPGRLNGESVKVTLSTKSLMESAAEEMSLARTTRRDKDLSERRIRPQNRYRNEAIAQALAYMKKQQDLGSSGRENLLKNLLAQKPSSPDRLLRLVEKQYSDISHQFAALCWLREELLRRRKNAAAPHGFATHFEDDTITLIEQTLDAMLADQRAAILSGFNIADASLAAARLNGSVSSQGLQRLYRDTVLDYGGLHKTFTTIIDSYGAEQLEQSLAFLVKALGADLAANGPSIAIERLNAIMQDIFKLQTLEGMIEHSDTLLQQFSRTYPLERKPAAYRLLQEILFLQAQQWLSEDKVASVPANLDIRTLPARIFFMQKFKYIVQMIPEKCYEDAAVRDNLVEAIQNCIDDIIADEAG